MFDFVVRIMTNSKPLTHTAPFSAKFKILTLEQINKQQTALFVYSYCNNLLPNFLNKCFIQNKSLTGRLTRQADNLFIPNFKYNFSRNTIKYAVPKLWNSLSNDLKHSPTLLSFKHKYKLSLLSL